MTYGNIKELHEVNLLGRFKAQIHDINILFNFWIVFTFL